MSILMENLSRFKEYCDTFSLLEHDKCSYTHIKERFRQHVSVQILCHYGTEQQLEILLNAPSVKVNPYITSRILKVIWLQTNDTSFARRRIDIFVNIFLEYLDDNMVDYLEKAESIAVNSGQVSYFKSKLVDHLMDENLDEIKKAYMLDITGTNLKEKLDKEGNYEEAKLSELKITYQALRRVTLFTADQTKCLMEGDNVGLEHMGKSYSAKFKIIDELPYLVIDDKVMVPSFTAFIRKITNKEILGSQYSKLSIKGIPWIQFQNKVLFFYKVIPIKNHLQRIINDPNVRDVFFGKEKVVGAGADFTEISRYKDPKLCVVVNTIPKKPLQIIGEFLIVYIEWGTFTEIVPRNYPPQETFPLEIKKKFDDILDKTLGLKFRLKFGNLTAINLDWKIVKGLYTKIPAIVFYVIRKGMIPIHNDELPQIIDGIATDVREGFYEPTGMFSENCCEYMNPICIGCSIGITNSTWVGTLGAFVKDYQGCIHLLTNYHVIYSEDGSHSVDQPAHEDHVKRLEEKLETLELTLFNVRDEERKAILNSKVEILKKELTWARDVDILFASSMKEKRENWKINDKYYGVDAAIAALKLNERGEPQRPIKPNKFACSELAFKKNLPKPIVLSGIKDIINDINSIEVWPIFKVGRTTGLTEGHIQEALGAFYSSMGDTLILQQSETIFHNLLMEEETEERTTFNSVWLDRQLMVRSKKGDFMEKGDSGCIWFDQDGKVIALGHGTLDTSAGVYAIGSPINAVLKALEVDLFFG
ncbi:hypothetical protein Glove_26g284 [Diversispora epigaea]|uniref:Uncharacterized protein n=1 Tax=Diversispora epigaea TaxID=1348612 RepID=A0A397JT94_9GLOM|nr:hypothetical protein Glove_26g284 [Diversispora epigaea]